MGNQKRAPFMNTEIAEKLWNKAVKRITANFMTKIFSLYCSI